MSVSSPKDEVVVNAYLGQRIRLARIALGVSQQALADALGLTFQQIQKYERGRNRISASRLFDIARVLGVSVEAFYEGLDEGVHGPLPSRMNDLTEAYERLSPQFGARELVEMNQAFIRISSPKTRAMIIQLAELIADGRLEDQPASFTETARDPHPGSQLKEEAPAPFAGKMAVA